MKKVYLITLLMLTSIFASDIELRTLIFSDVYGNIEPKTNFDLLRQRNYIRPEICIDMFDYTASFDLSLEYYYDSYTEDEIPEPCNILREAYFSFYLPLGDLLIGQRYITKGKADVFSPLNIVTASFREQFSGDEAYQKRVGELSLEYKHYIDDENSIEFLYIPFPRSDYQDGHKSYIPELSATLDKSSDPYLTDGAHSFYITYNRYSYSFDTQFIYGNYMDGNYNYLLNTVDSTITKTFNRVQTIGASISSAIGSVGIVQEVAFNLTEDFGDNNPGIRNSDIFSTTQLTKTLFGRTYGQIDMIFQHVFDWEEKSKYEEYCNDIHLQPTDNILFFIGHLHDSFLREKLYLALNLGFFFSTDVYIAPRVNYTLTDNIKIETGADIYADDYEAKVLEDDLGGDNLFLRLKFEY